MKLSTRYQIVHWASLVSMCLTAVFPILVLWAYALGYPKEDHHCSISMYLSDKSLIGYSFGLYKGDANRIWVGTVSHYPGEIEEGIQLTSRTRCVYPGYFSTYSLTLPLMIVSGLLVFADRKNRRLIRQRAFPIGEAAKLGYVPAVPLALTQKAKRHARTAEVGS